MLNRLLLLICCFGFGCNGANSSADTTDLSDSAILASAKVDSIRKASYKNHDLTIIFLEASQQLIQCQLLLERAGQKKGITDSLLVNSKKGDTLHQTMMKLFEVGRLYATSKEDKKRFAELKTPDSSKLWLQKYFKDVPVDDALNTLMHFQNDCNAINAMVPR